MYWTRLVLSDMRPVFRVLADRNNTPRVCTDVPKQTINLTLRWPFHFNPYPLSAKQIR